MWRIRDETQHHLGFIYIIRIIVGIVKLPKKVIHTVDASEITRPTTVWMYKKHVNNGNIYHINW